MYQSSPTKLARKSASDMSQEPLAGKLSTAHQQGDEKELNRLYMQISRRNGHIYNLDAYNRYYTIAAKSLACFPILQQGDIDGLQAELERIPIHRRAMYCNLTLPFNRDTHVHQCYKELSQHYSLLMAATEMYFDYQLWYQDDQAVMKDCSKISGHMSDITQFRIELWRDKPLSTDQNPFLDIIEMLLQNGGNPDIKSPLAARHHQSAREIADAHNAQPELQGLLLDMFTISSSPQDEPQPMETTRLTDTQIHDADYLCLLMSPPPIKPVPIPPSDDGFASFEFSYVPGYTPPPSRPAPKPPGFDSEAEYSSDEALLPISVERVLHPPKPILKSRTPSPETKPVIKNVGFKSKLTDVKLYTPHQDDAGESSGTQAGKTPIQPISTDKPMEAVKVLPSRKKSPKKAIVPRRPWFTPKRNKGGQTPMRTEVPY